MDWHRLLIVGAALLASCAVAGPQWRETPGATEQRTAEKAQAQAVVDMAAARAAYQAARTQAERDAAILAFFERATAAQSNAVAAAKAEQKRADAGTVSDTVRGVSR